MNGVKLEDLLKKVREANDVDLVEIISSSTPDAVDVQVERVEYDSRMISSQVGRTGRENGAIFACVRGEHTDGHRFAENAVRDGAVALICDHRLPLDVPQIVVRDVRASMSAVAAILAGRPALGMTMIGLTGTNGKTTTAYLLRSIMRAAGHKCGMLGTIVYDDGEREEYADRTTPEGPDIQQFLARMAENGATCCVMEASSHGLDQGRLKGCLFDCVGFSNLTPEHLEYHRDMESYFAAKHRLFTEYVKPAWCGAANAEDAYGHRLLEEFPDRLRPFSLQNAKILESGLGGMQVEIAFSDGETITVHSPLIGDYNVSNILESVTIAEAIGVSREAIRAGVAGASQVPGRLERYSLRNGVTAFIDFAHSSDGMEKVMATIRPLTKGRLIVVWGAGGDRSKEKRPAVGAKMAEYADLAVVTSDNPRSERPEDIAKDVEAGVLAYGGRSEHRTILDRGEAIYYALDAANANDVVLIAGKGPERTIEYADREVPFSDSGTLLAWAGDRSVEVLGR